MKRKTGFLVPLSPQNLLDCSTSDGNLGCRGGYISKSYNYIIRNGGVDSESFYPYEHQVFISRSQSSYLCTLSPSAPEQLVCFAEREVPVLRQGKGRLLLSLPHPPTRR